MKRTASVQSFDTILRPLFRLHFLDLEIDRLQLERGNKAAIAPMRARRQPSLRYNRPRRNEPIGASMPLLIELGHFILFHAYFEVWNAYGEHNVKLTMFDVTSPQPIGRHFLHFLYCDRTMFWTTTHVTIPPQFSPRRSEALIWAFTVRACSPCWRLNRIRVCA
jgi:hypothetical protein